MDLTGQTNATQPNNKYEDQLVWDNNLHEPIDDEPPNEEMENTKEAGEKRKVVVNNTIQNKQRKNAVMVTTQKENKSVQEKMTELGEAAPVKESGFETDVNIEWQLKQNDKEFNL
eukprot:5067299-Ditylum_brightwellii.AAC.1